VAVTQFHGGLAEEIRAELNQVLQPRYVARLAPRVVYEEVEIQGRRDVRPDVAVYQPQPPSGESTAGSVAISTAPVRGRVPLEEPLRLYTVEVLQASTRELVTAIEILSPVNKRPGKEAHQEYLKKRRELLRSSVHLMEIDLLRGGERPPLEGPVPPAPWYVTLSRAGLRPSVEVWPLQMWDRLPVLPVPLLEPDPDAPLDLARAVASVYERGAYALLIDYRVPPPPPSLTEEDAAWVDGLLKDLRVQ